MHTDTGQLFRNLTPEQLAALQQHDPRIVAVSEEVADAVEVGQAVQKVYRAQHARKIEAELLRKQAEMEARTHDMRKADG